MSPTPTFRVGDKVTPNPDVSGVPVSTIGRIYTVSKVNPKNLRCDADDGGRGLNFPPDALLPATGDNANVAPGIGRPYKPIDLFALGEVVTVTKAWRDLTTTTPLVVVKDDGRGRVSLARLGGDGSRYVRFPRTSIERRDLAWLAEALR